MEYRKLASTKVMSLRCGDQDNSEEYDHQERDTQTDGGDVYE